MSINPWNCLLSCIQKCRYNNHDTINSKIIMLKSNETSINSPNTKIDNNEDKINENSSRKISKKNKRVRFSEKVKIEKSIEPINGIRLRRRRLRFVKVFVS